jgi:hypothetical protein
LIFGWYPRPLRWAMLHCDAWWGARLVSAAAMVAAVKAAGTNVPCLCTPRTSARHCNRQRAREPQKPEFILSESYAFFSLIRRQALAILADKWAASPRDDELPLSRIKVLLTNS